MVQLVRVSGPETRALLNLMLTSLCEQGSRLVLGPGSFRLPATAHHIALHSLLCLTLALAVRFLPFSSR